MNERIQELARQADQYAIAMNPDQDSYGRSANPRKFAKDRDAKFAELIVRECIDVVDNVYHEQTGTGNKLSRRRTPYQEIVNALEDHFGVE